MDNLYILGIIVGIIVFFCIAYILVMMIKQHPIWSTEWWCQHVHRQKHHQYAYIGRITSTPLIWSGVFGNIVKSTVAIEYVYYCDLCKRYTVGCVYTTEITRTVDPAIYALYESRTSKPAEQVMDFHVFLCKKHLKPYVKVHEKWPTSAGLCLCEDCIAEQQE